jgi:hypothetical protein
MRRGDTSRADVEVILADLKSLAETAAGNSGLERPRLHFDPAVLTELRPPDVGSREFSLAQAERELERLHAVELARLLREAAAIRLSGGRVSVLLEEAPLEPDVLSACLREELGLALLDGLAPRGVVLRIARACLRPDVQAWPSSLSLAIASLLLAPHAVGRLRLGQALLESGCSGDAERVLRATLRGSSQERAPGPGAGQRSLRRALALASALVQVSPVQALHRGGVA